MKRLLAAGSTALLTTSGAFAGDLAPAPGPVYDWTGFYLGGNIGAAFNSSSADEQALQADLPSDIAHDLANEVQSSSTVFTGGGELGYNWQIDSFVIGAETDFNFTGF